MQALTIQQMERLEGEGFWKGVVCGLAGAATVAVILSPEPVSKFALFSLASGWASCLA